MPELEGMMKRQQVLAAFGEFAIQSQDLDAVLMEACRLVGEATGTGRAKVLEIQEGCQELLVRAGVGWAPDVVGMVRLQMNERSSETYAIKAGTPMVTQDIAKDDRFDVPDFMKRAGVVAFVNVPIIVPGQRPYGVLQIDDTRSREFGDDEIEFLRTYAMILGPVIDRLHLVEQRARDRELMRASEARYRLLIGSWAQAEWETDADGVVIADSPSWRAYTGQTVEEWLGYGWLNAIHPHDRPLAEKQWREAVAAHGLVNAEFRLCDSNGGWRWTNVRAAPVLDAEGSLVKWVGMNINIDPRKSAELALRNSESRLRAMFDSVDQGFMEVEVEMSPEGRAIDWRYVALNPSFYRLTGMKDVTGRLASEVFPDREPEWAERYAQVVTTGEPMRFELPAAAIGRWFDINLVNVGGAGSSRIAVVYDDVTERKRSEALLRENEAQHAFLLKLSDALRAEPNAEAVADRALRMLYERMGLHRCQIGIYKLEEDKAEFPHQVHDDSLPPLPAQVRVSDFPKAFEIASERTLVVENVAEQEGLSDADRVNIQALGLRSFVNATLRKGAKNPLWAIVAGSMHPRTWTQSEISLVEEVAERTWATVERARAEAALRDSEERFRQFSDASSDILWIRDAKSLRMVFASPAFETIYGLPAPDKGGNDSLRSWARLIEPEYLPKVFANLRRLQAGERIEQEFRIRRALDGSLRWIHNDDFPLLDSAGQVRWIAGVGSDMTDAREFADRQEILVAELQHRTRNLIAVVGALAERTINNATSLDDFAARFRLRLSSLSRVQGLLSHVAKGERVTFDELLNAELTAHGGSDFLAAKVTFDGPTGVPLRSGSVQTFALALHELTTNAVKYGAFSSPHGHLRVTWRVEPAVGTEPPHLHVEWRETGVKMSSSSKPTGRGGYGRELIERALPFQLGARTSYELRDDGVFCTVTVPISGQMVTGG